MALFLLNVGSMQSRLVAVASLLVPVVAACANDVGSRPEPPELRIESPARGTMREGLSSVEVIGTVGASATGSAAASVSVNGIDAPLAADGSFRVTVPVHAGTNLISTVALSADGGRADDMRGVLTGTFRPATATVENAASATSIQRMAPATFARDTPRACPLWAACLS